jgi:hypothetical protein
MSDQPSAFDKPAKKPAPAPLPKHQTLTLSQHFFIWSLVIVVGVLFGMGSTFNQFGRGERKIQGVSETEVMIRQNTARKLQEIIDPLRRNREESFAFYDVPGMGAYDQYAQRILLARFAEREGLLPAGKALDAIVSDFLNQGLPDTPGRRYYQALVEHQEGEKAVTEAELRRFLAERFAVKLLFARHIATPAVPLGMADDVVGVLPQSWYDSMAGLKGDQVEVDEVILDASHLLSAIAADDAEIQPTYEKLRPTRFAKPAACTLSVAYADTAALAASVNPADAEVEKYYQEHQDQYRLPPPPIDPKNPDAKPPEPGVKPLAEVADGIREILRKRQAEVIAKGLIEGFDQGAIDLEGQKDNASFKAAAAKQGLLVKESLLVEQPLAAKPADAEDQEGKAKDNNLDLGELGKLDEAQVRLFDQEPGFVSSVIQSTGDHANWLVVRLEGKREAGFKDLQDAEVRKAVCTVLAGQRAYKDFLAKADEFRAAAEKLGLGGLKRYLGNEDAMPWKTAGKTVTLRALAELRPPAPDPGVASTAERRLVASLAMPDRPVVMAEIEERDPKTDPDLPRVRLIQAIAYQPAAPPTAETRTRFAAYYRQWLTQYRQRLFQVELNNLIGRR